MRALTSTWEEFGKTARQAWLKALREADEKEREREKMHAFIMKETIHAWVRLTKVYREYAVSRESVGGLGESEGKWVETESPVWLQVRAIQYMERHPDRPLTELIGEGWTMAVRETPQDILGIKVP